MGSKWAQVDKHLLYAGEKYYEKEISFRVECLVNGEELASGKLVFGVIQKIAVGVVY